MKFCISVLSVALLSFYLSGCSKSDEPKSKPEPTPDLAAILKVDVYKTPTCGCCGDWIEHLQSQGFTTTTHDQNDLSDLKKSLDIPPGLQSCHTAVNADGFFFEGHIPAKFIARFLTDTPKDALGLTVPGMPLGSPGMEMGGKFSPYEILLVKNDGSTEVYAKINSYREQL